MFLFLKNTLNTGKTIRNTVVRGKKNGEIEENCFVERKKKGDLKKKSARDTVPLTEDNDPGDRVCFALKVQGLWGDSASVVH